MRIEMAASRLTSFMWVMLEVPIQASLILVIFGFFAPLAPALYTAALVLNLFQAAAAMGQLVFGPKIPSEL